ncbi:cuticlin-4-like [Panonychus citri]|uniref:cuticlin-4-like n=1 Tax=Panonychus citri TaxID=50023 RepID=UPI0023078BE4|nr:cuticlin-4-like [Panonychus citri]
MDCKQFKQLIHCLAIIVIILSKNGECKEIDSKTDLQEEEATDPETRSPAYLPKSKSSSNPSYYGKGESYDDENSKQNGDNHLSTDVGSNSHSRSNEPSLPLERPEVPLIKGIHVRCEKSSMSVKIDFDRPFYGVIFSKGHYSDPKCVHAPPATGQSEISFDLRLDACGMVGSDEAHGARGSSKPWLFTESTIIIQHDPQVQEVWDQARRLRCTWYDYYEKTVSFKSLGVEMMDAVTTNFLGDNIQCWMQIQAGKGPFNNEATGLVKIGQTMTMVLAIKDDDGKFDMLVRNCVAHDGNHRPIQLVDEYGCISRPRIMSKFRKLKNFGYSASVATYAYFRAFKFPDSVNVHFQCVIQVCREACPVPSCTDTGSEPTFHPEEGGEESKQSPTAVDINGNRPATFNVNSVSSSQSTLINAKQYPGAAMINSGVAPRVMVASQLPSSRLDDLNRTWPLPAATFIHPKTLSSHPLYQRPRTKRAINNTTAVSTQKTIRVVAPGDISFDFTSTTDETETLDIFGPESSSSSSSSSSSLLSFDSANRYCISGIVLTLTVVIVGLMLIVSSLIAVFLYLRVNLMNRSCSVSLKDSISYQNLDPSKLASLRSLQVKTPGEASC